MEALTLALLASVAFAAPTPLSATENLITSAFNLVPGVSNDIRFQPTPEPNEVVDNSHIVMLKPDSPDVSTILAQLNLSPDSSDVGHVYDNKAFRGFAANLDAARLDALRSIPGILSVEPDVKFVVTTVRPKSPWGLQRISSSETVTGNATALAYNYTYEGTDPGAGVDIYIMDTGIYTAHHAFNGRAKIGYSFQGDGQDHFGHGTHVSGTAAGLGVGISTGANLIGVKVLGDDGGGSTKSVLAGLDYIVQAHQTRSTQPGFVASVMSASLGANSGPTVTAIDTGFKSALAQNNFHAVIAAGNSGSNACNGSPSKLGGNNSTALVIGSIAMNDAISSFSNTGPCVDLYAPGESTVSSWDTGPDDLAALDGTSMATPHVTGIVAYLSVLHPELAKDPAAMKQYLYNTAFKGVITGNTVAGDRGLLVNNGETA